MKDLLLKRNDFICKIRKFFENLNYLEVDTPCLSPYPASELFIDPIKAFPFDDKQAFYLITTPEYYMKRLIAKGSGPIFQIGSSFRKAEYGSMHSPEFTMLEWYAPGYTYRKIMDETAEFLKCMLDITTVDFSTYQACFLDILGLDLNFSESEKITTKIDRLLVGVDSNLDTKSLSWDSKLNMALGFLIQPKLGLDRPIIVYDFYAEPSCLAKLKENEKIACRFEAYYLGIELCNGFLELSHIDKIKESMDHVSKAQEEIGKEKYPQDIYFLNDLENDLPPTAGVALGVDRLLAVIQKKESISEVRPFELRKKLE